ncbi:MAG: acetyl/propionyl-CoA carboxylase subunit alpha, partial [Gammaproteobacteria bacterium]|nr:acetyl/propionyl-CoA carboxylase subunit alpha [Gammaproteobacteria bacterium]
QKLVEEAPSAAIDEGMRERMGRAAVAAAQAVSYSSAGTVEFLVAGGEFYFLEMNTRLQVEHPVTEWVTGQDLVELMFRVAAGERLPLTQADVTLKGWAIESRVYAEDPYRNFLPSVGRLVRYLPPEENNHVRVDTGVFEGGEVSMFYDPMIAKLVTYGKDRETARAHMLRALDRFYIRGVASNINFLANLIAHPRFAEGRFNTNMIAEEYPDGFRIQDIPEGYIPRIVAVAASVHRRYREREAKISGQLPGHERKVLDDWVVLLNDNRYPVHTTLVSDGHDVVLGDRTYAVRSKWTFLHPLFIGYVDGVEVCLQVHRESGWYRVAHAGHEAQVRVLTPRNAELFELMPAKVAEDMSNFVLSPMPGLLVSLMVDVGREVKSGEQVAVIEAMKMENVLRAPRDGVVTALHAAEGDTLVVDQPILEFSQDGAGGDGQ